MIYRGMDRKALDAAYDNGAAVGEKRAGYVAGWRERNVPLNARLGIRRDIAYGPAARNTLDFIPVGRPNAPIFAFIHGGYWQSVEKEVFAWVAEGPLALGFNVALIEYTLAPEARMDQIVAEVRQAITYLNDNANKLGALAQIVVSGHSAGGHLTATSIDLPGVVAGVAISGLFDLEPIRLCYLNDKLRLDAEEAFRNSPQHAIPSVAVPLVVTYGASELPELVRQSEEYHQAWIAKGNRGVKVPCPGTDHFSVLDELWRPDGAICKLLPGLILPGHSN
jgi:arylformamidase